MNNNNNRRNARRNLSRNVPGRAARQRGVVLIVALIVLLLVTVIGVGGIRTSSLGLLISANEEERVLALQTAQAAAEEIAESADHFTVVGAPGTVVKCTAVHNCADRSLSLASPALAAVDDAVIERVHPERGNPPRLVAAYSARALKSTYFRVDVNNDRGDHGRAEVAQGFLRLITNSQQ